MTEFIVGLSSGICIIYPVFYLKLKLYKYRFGDFIPGVLITFNGILFFDNEDKFNRFETVLVILGAIGFLSCAAINGYYTYRRWKILRGDK